MAPSDSTPLAGLPRRAPMEDPESAVLSSPALREATADPERRRRAERPAAPVPIAASATAAAAPGANAPTPATATSTPAAAPPVACPQIFDYLGDRWHALPREAHAWLSSSEAEATTAFATTAGAPTPATTASTLAAALPVACPEIFDSLGDRWHDLSREAQACLSSSQAAAATCTAATPCTAVAPCTAADRVRTHQLEDDQDRAEQKGIQTAIAKTEGTCLQVATDLQAKHASLTMAAATVVGRRWRSIFGLRLGA